MRKEYKNYFMDPKRITHTLKSIDHKLNPITDTRVLIKSMDQKKKQGR